MEESPNVLRFYREWIAEAPDELITIVVHRKAQTLPCPPGDVRSVVPARVVVLHACLRRCGAHRRGHRHYGRSLTPDQLPADGFPNLAAWGAAARVGEDETAFGGRSAGHTFIITAVTHSGEGFDQEREWVRNVWSALEPYHTSVYVNFLMEEGEERIRQAYGAEKYDRLKALKRRYDPDNFFRLNQNIGPAATA